MKGRKWFSSILSIIVVLTLVLTACSNNSKNDSDSNNQAASNNKATNSTSSDTNTSATTNDSTDDGSSNTSDKPASEPFELTVWSHNVANAMPEANDATANKIYDFIQKKMEEKFPGITIKYIDKGWADTLRQAIMVSVMGGNPPDVADGEDFIPEFARIGALLEVPEDVASQLAPGPMKAAMHDGKPYAVAQMTGVFSLIYNKDVMSKVGLDPNTPPKTWDEWLDMSKKATANGKGQYYGTIVQNMGLGGAFRLAPFMRQVGGDFTTPDWSQVTFDSPENVKALTFLRDLAKTSPPGSTSMTDEGQFFNLLNSGKVAFAVNGPWHIAWGKANGCVNCGFAPLPVPEAGKTGNVIVGNTLFYALKQSKHPEAAVEFLKIIASQEYQEMEANATGRLPANMEAGKNVDLLKTYPELQVFDDIVANEQSSPLPVYAKNGPQIWEAWYKAQDITLTTDKPIEDALKEAQKTAEEQLK
ncbi:carbohydrate ABC transporter substrate-binding protein (CUT1 family) [Paenibacillus taihuensis]|uniref:Carbohydrate ABC transporter substrate-binding protein (CUT1 family) n=1 Tax=Paenibacillus taihuensis TaxID=1156355 RepID=A0A3D9RS57_9BACL|nr:ABC transporter substrate-binding protein [Paenibacillus taihuensis]REE82637.1 carbohydrate ABC transporter substrate-binding protein (CUT1 family) [Paenibacillus taihuensis]